MTGANPIGWCLHSREPTCLRLPFQVSTNMSTLYRRFPGECIATFFLHLDPKTANMSQFLQLGPLDFDPDLGYVSYFLVIESANNHSHISKPHPLNNTDTLGGRFPWPVTFSKRNWFLEHTPNLHIWHALPRSWDSFFFARFAINAVWKQGLEVQCALFRTKLGHVSKLEFRNNEQQMSSTCATSSRMLAMTLGFRENNSVLTKIGSCKCSHSPKRFQYLKLLNIGLFNVGFQKPVAFGALGFRPWSGIC